MADEEPTITVPLNDYTNLFNLAAVRQKEEQILATAQAIIQKYQQAEQAKPKLVKDS